MTYEDLFKIAGPRFEAIEEAMQMVSPADFGRMGRRYYTATMKAYAKFAETGDLAFLDEVADNLAPIMGYYRI